MLKLLATLLLVTLSTPVFAGEGLANRLAGEWRGVGVQSGNQDWLVELSLAGNGATVDYPDVPCGGTWVFSSVKPDSVTSTEIVSYGRELCIDNSTTILTSYGQGQLLALWKNPDGSDLAIAVLHLDSPKPNDFKADWSESMRAWQNR